jgi:HEXXH motif-containing protein
VETNAARATWRNSLDLSRWLQRASEKIWVPDASMIAGYDDLATYDLAWRSLTATCANEWLFHPCSGPVIASEGTIAAKSHLQLYAWVAQNSNTRLPSVRIDSDILIWTVNGGKRVNKGIYFPETLRQILLSDDRPLEVPLDPWALSINIETPSQWKFIDATCFPPEQMREDVRKIALTLSILRANLPDCLDWISQRVRVIVPLAAMNINATISYSMPNVPGAAFLSVQDSAQVGEALVHEAAHNELFVLECQEPIVQHDHKKLYFSPLRQEERPLRGIFLACHALYYIAKYYTDLSNTGIFNAGVIDERRQGAISSFTTCRNILNLAENALTETGKRTLASMVSNT